MIFCSNLADENRHVMTVYNENTKPYYYIKT